MIYLARYTLILGCCVFAMPALSSLTFGDDEGLAGWDEDVPMVLTPTRLKQSEFDAPASVSVITSDTIRHLQIKSVPEALRYASGMVVDYASGNAPRINYHGTNGLVPRRMQVLLDGISVYRTGYARVSWPTLPVAMNDIQYIEVIRSPSSSAFGQNSMMAVINIVTKDAESTEPPSLYYSLSNQEERHQQGSISGPINDRINYMLSVSSWYSTGYDENYRDVERRDGSNMNYLRSRLHMQLSDQTTASWFGAYAEGLHEHEYRSPRQTSFPDVEEEDQYYQAEITHAFNANHEIKIKSHYSHANQIKEWGNCYPAVYFLDSLSALDQVNPEHAEAILAGENYTSTFSADSLEAQLADQVAQDLATLGDAANEDVCGTMNENGSETKWDVEIEDTISLNEHLRMVYGAGYQFQSMESETMLNGRVSTAGYRAFGNGEWKFGRWTMNAGFMAEEERHLDRVEYSPRIGINYRVNSDSVVRYSLSKAVRTPDILETDRDWQYQQVDPSASVLGSDEIYFYKRATFGGELSSEEIISNELGWVGRIYRDSYTFHYDAKLFYDRLNNLISEKMTYLSYSASNGGNSTLKGIDLEMDATFPLRGYVNQVSVHGRYSYVDATTNRFYERSLHADHTGSIYGILKTVRNEFASISYYGNSPINGEAFDGYEIGGGKQYIINGHGLEFSGKAVYYPDLNHKMTVNETFNVENNSKSPWTFYLSTRIDF